MFIVKHFLRYQFNLYNMRPVKAWGGGQRGIMACNFCGCEEVVIGDGNAWCADERCGAQIGNTRMGLIAGRHEMPVDGYLLPSNLTDLFGFHDGAYKAAKDATESFIQRNGSFELYLTGLTVAAIGAVEGTRKSGIKNPISWNFDATSKEFVKIRLDA